MSLKNVQKIIRSYLMELQPDEIFLNPVFGYLSSSQQKKKYVDVCFPVLYVTIGITNRISTLHVILITASEIAT